MSQTVGPITVEKIGGTTMSDYASVRDSIVLGYRSSPYQRILVVSAYGGITDRLLEHKKSGQPGIFALFRTDAGDDAWIKALEDLRQVMHSINAQWFKSDALATANDFVNCRIDQARSCLADLASLCCHVKLMRWMMKLRCYGSRDQIRFLIVVESLFERLFHQGKYKLYRRLICAEFF